MSVTKDDLEAIERGMTKSSAWITGHDHAATDNSPVPQPGELRDDILKLEAFVKSVRGRQKGKPEGKA